MIATTVDPLADPVPAAWDDFVVDGGLLPLWGSRLLRTAAWCTQTPSSMVLVHEPGSPTPVAIFHARHLGLVRPTRFIRPGRIPPLSMTECRTTVQMPAAYRKRRVVLEHIVTSFEPGRSYPERVVDAVLRAWYADHATLRRYLVDEQLMAREAGRYWRIGGPVWEGDIT